MADEPKRWTSPSGTVKSDCPKCVEAGILDPKCELCDGTGACGLAHAVAWILAHGKTDPPASGG